MKDSIERVVELPSSIRVRPAKQSKRLRATSIVALTALVAAGVAWHLSESSAANAPVAVALPTVSVALPLQRNIEPRLGFLGQFAAVNRVELRAQVGGTLTDIRFKDGDVVKKGDVLFVIDPVPYEIKLSQATAQLATANARLELATRELVRAQTLQRGDAGSAQNVDQRAAEKREAQASVDAAKASIRDAQFDLDHTKIAAPFTGRIGTHQVSVGNLVAGSRGASSPTTLLATLVSLDPVYLNFDMSEADYMRFMRSQPKGQAQLENKVEISLSDEKRYEREGRLNFLDNTLDRSSGTIHARAVVSNPDLLMTPGAFARVRLPYSAAVPALLVPDSAVLADQSERMVLTLGPDNTVVPKHVQLGDLRDGLRVIQAGLSPTDKVIIEGIPMAAPGAKVAPRDGAIKLASSQG
ncbi:efflux transporter periplasmic adaptor subunit [Bordetella genomosp. 8]|uniref:Efflux transporter periplasmic adaptor subunit n=1 Tax=Bordetella genomosp. 8 TaxID=1416806 RepID=A0A1W6YPE9_9BORD|nr:efflux RND transporter periplasmic adaptor subunit [Bordetella genomosp. 8]ARP82970.1 efflux transporter periplasmic adaptor subunit [Bordetella genomosp. 8]